MGRAFQMMKTSHCVEEVTWEMVRKTVGETCSI